MIKTLKILIITVVISAAFLLQCEKCLFAIGSFSLGVNTGATYDPNYMEREINIYNQIIESYGGDQITVPYSFVTGFNIKYQFNYLLFRIGGHYAKTWTGASGAYTPPVSGTENKIKISTYQASFPITIAFILPVKERTYFYMGAGMTYHMAYIKITQSNPSTDTTEQLPGLGDVTEFKYSGNFPGLHFLAGAEVPVYKNYSLSVEWIHQEGRSYPMTNTSGPASDKKQINIRGDFLLFGVNYYISI